MPAGPAKRRTCKDCQSTTRPAPKPGPRCASCWRIKYQAERKRAHDTRVTNLYGLLPGEYEKLLATQGGVCCLCLKPFSRKRGSVDHDHAVELLLGVRASVRGIIHSWENTILGRMRDDAEWFERIAEYLRSPPAQRHLPYWSQEG